MAKSAEPKKISELIGELEKKVSRLREGGDDLEDSIRLYKEGVALAKQCERRLNDARLEIEKIGLPDDIASLAEDKAEDKAENGDKAAGKAAYDLDDL